MGCTEKHITSCVHCVILQKRLLLGVPISIPGLQVKWKELIGTSTYFAIKFSVAFHRKQHCTALILHAFLLGSPSITQSWQYITIENHIVTQCSVTAAVWHNTTRQPRKRRGAFPWIWGLWEQTNYCSKAAAWKLNNLDYPQVAFRPEELTLGLFSVSRKAFISGHL